MDAEEWWPEDAFPKIGAQGLFGVTVPPEYGGAGLDLVAAGLVMQAFSRWNHAMALSCVAHDNLCAQQHLSQRQREPAPQISARSLRGPKDRRARPHRARRRLRCAGLDAHDGAPRRRPLRAERRQDLHHQRSGRRRAARLRQDRSRRRARTAFPPSSSKRIFPVSASRRSSRKWAIAAARPANWCSRIAACPPRIWSARKIAASRS